MKNTRNLLLSLEMKGSFWYLVHCNWNGKTTVIGMANLQKYQLCLMLWIVACKYKKNDKVITVSI